jgi:hypothetical protein
MTTTLLRDMGQEPTSGTWKDSTMRKLRIIGSWTLAGLLGGPLVGCFFVGGFIPDTFSVDAFKSAVTANIVFIVASVSIGLVVGLAIGAFQAVSGRNKLPDF